MSTAMLKESQAIGAEGGAQASDLVQALVRDAYARGARHQRELGLSVVVGADEHEHHPADAKRETTVSEAREQLAKRLPDGVECPVCFQLAKVRRRAMTGTVLRGLAALYATHGRSEGHMPTIAREQLADVAHQGGYLTLSQHWGLMVDERAVRSDGGRAGYWRVTDLGEAFLRGERTVPKYALIYNGGCLELNGDPITARSVLGETFDYASILERTEISDATNGRLFFLPEAKAAA